MRLQLMPLWFLAAGSSAPAASAPVTVHDVAPTIMGDGQLWFDLASWRLFTSVDDMWFWVS